MDDIQLANILSIIYPYFVILFWILVFVAIVWGIKLFIQRIRHASKK